MMSQQVRPDRLDRWGPLGTGFGRLAAAVRRLQGESDVSQLLLRAGAYSAAEGIAALNAEIDRSRRYNHPICLLMLEPDVAQAEGAHPERGDTRGPASNGRTGRTPVAALVDLGRLLVQRVRTSDVVAADPGHGRFMLIFPETELADVGAPIRRLDEAIVGTLALSVRWGVAHFPGCALTAEDLVQYALAGFDAERSEATPAEAQEDGDAEVATA